MNAREQRQSRSSQHSVHFSNRFKSVNSTAYSHAFLSFFLRGECNWAANIYSWNSIAYPVSAAKKAQGMLPIDYLLPISFSLSNRIQKNARSASGTRVCQSNPDSADSRQTKALRQRKVLLTSASGRNLGISHLNQPFLDCKKQLSHVCI